MSTKRTRMRLALNISLKNLKNRWLTPQQSIEFVGKNKGLAIGNGLVFYFMHGLIGIGWVLAPAYAVIAATISINEHKTYHSLV